MRCCLAVILVISLLACGTGAPPSETSSGGPTPDTISIQREQVELESITIEVLAAGSPDADDAIVLLASRGCGALCFVDFLPRLADAGFRVVAPNPRGIEGSDGALEDLTLHVLAADVAGVIEQMELGRAHVLGHGFGNRVARCLATDRPDLVTSLILLGAGGQVEGDPEALEAWQRLYAPGLADDDVRAALQIAMFAPGSDATAWVELPRYPELARAQEAADINTPREDWLAGGEAPMLVIQGRHDRIAPPANGRWLRDRFGDRVELVELANAGHALLPEQPGEIVDAIGTFIQRDRR